LWLAATSPAEGHRLLSDGVGDLASQITASTTKEQTAKVAVLPFRELEGRATVLGTYLSEALVTELFKRGGLEIVERTMLDRIMAELKLGQSGLIDPSTARQVGQVASRSHRHGNDHRPAVIRGGELPTD
jgi:TolB-like protein